VVAPCRCAGIISLAHRKCLVKQLAVEFNDAPNDRWRCEVCRSPLVAYRWQTLPVWLYALTTPFTSENFHAILWSACDCRLRDFFCQCQSLLGWVRHALACVGLVPVFAVALWLIDLLFSRAGPHVEFLAYFDVLSVLCDVYIDCRFVRMVFCPHSTFVLVALCCVAVAWHAGLLTYALSVPDLRGIRILLSFALVWMLGSLRVVGVLFERGLAWASNERARAELESPM
jgi:hypothetical protein